MQFETLGEKGKPTIVAIHGMFANADSIKPFAQILAEEYYVVLPTLNGHHPMSADYHTPMEEAEQIYSYLEAEGIEELALVQGTSLGASVAFVMAVMNRIPAKCYFMDSPQFYKYGTLRRNLSYSKILMLVNQYRSKTASSAGAGDIALDGTMTGKMLGTGEDAYSGMVQGTSAVYDVLTDTTIRNAVETCFNFTYSPIEPAMQSRCVFYFGAKDPSSKQEKDIKKHYPNAIVTIMPNHAQGTFQVLNPQKYASMLKMGIF